jgi:hypothetical protein
VTELPSDDLYAEEAPDVRQRTKQDALTMAYYALIAAGQHQLTFKESADSSRKAEMQTHPDPESVDWSTNKPMHLHGRDPDTRMTYCVTFKPGVGYRVFVPPMYELTTHRPEVVREMRNAGMIESDRVLYWKGYAKQRVSRVITNPLTVSKAVHRCVHSYLVEATRKYKEMKQPFAEFSEVET